MLIEMVASCELVMVAQRCSANHSSSDSPESGPNKDCKTEPTHGNGTEGLHRCEEVRADQWLGLSGV